VRTTLKRGHGRTAFDGNGSARSTLPPDALSPVTLYTAEGPPPKSRLRRTGRVLGWIGLVLVMVVAGFGGGVYLWIHESVAATEYKGPDKRKIETTLQAVAPHHATIALVLGYDHRVGQGSAPSRSDTIMLLRADPNSQTISQLSIPRDLNVEIRCPKPGFTPFTSKINAAYSSCGALGSLATVEALTHLPINYLITVDFRGFKKVVNILGGVWVDVDRRYFNNQGGPYGYATINIQPGYQRLTGGKALDFVRYRETDSDIVRVARQQLFVQAMKEQFAHSFSIDKIPGLVGAVSSNVQIALPGGKHLSISLLEGYAQFARDLPPGHFCQAKIADVTGYSNLSAPTDAISNAVHDFLTPCVKQANEANTVALGGHVKQTAPKPAQTRIVVLNGNGVAGAAADAKYRLQQRGYKMLDPVNGQEANAPSRQFRTQVYYQGWSKRAKAAAGSLQQVMAPAQVHPLPASLRPLCGGTMLCIVLGTTYHNAITPPAQQQVIKHQAPDVYNDRSATLPLVQEAQRQVPFPLMVPNVLDSSSVTDTYGGDPPMRAYTIDGGFKAVRFIFRRPSANEYWGVEETNWKAAPVLAETAYHRVIGGRNYSFYYHGAHLHMVVLHVGAVDYWVVNTLLDSLSNETMIAIAKNLQPLNPPHTRKKPKTAAGKGAKS
jgi:LCP family protein required for cell wall assembly